MNNQTRGEERGIALILAILALFVVTAVGAGLIVLSNSEVRTSANYRDQQVALYAAKAGLEEARDRMLASNANPLVLPVADPTAVLPGSVSGVVYIIASGVSPWLNTSTKFGISMYDTEILNELTAAGVTTPPTGTWYTSTASIAGYSGPTANPVPYQWVRINLKTDSSATPYLVDGNTANKGKQVCYDVANRHEVVISAVSCTTANSNYQAVYELTSFAMTPNLTFRMLQQDIVRDFVNISLPGALTVAGPSLSSSVLCASGSTCNSSGDYITGDNAAGCNTGSNVPAIATSDATTQSNFSTGLAPNAANIVGTGGSPSVSNASASLSNLNTVSQVEALVSQYEALAGSNVGPNCTTLNLGTAASPTITVVTNAGGSSCNLNSGTTGYGILVVTGTLDYVNVNSYQGVILLLGTAQFIETSSKDTTFTGALFMAQDRDPATGALLAGPSLGTTPVFNYHHGNASSTDPSVQYNACVISQVENNTVANYRVLSQREVGYQ